MPTRGTAVGRIKQMMMVQIMGNMIFSSLETGRSCSITIIRSFFVVSARMIGGWMMGTSAI